MAEIPVERKEGGGMTWLWVLLAILLAALLLWWLLADDDDAADPAGVDTMQVDTMTTDGMPADGVATNAATAPGGPVTDMSMLIPTIAPEMVGREVRLTGAQVQEVVGDIGFWIGPSSDQRVFAVLSQEPTPATPMEGMADVNAGAMADITGTIRTRGEILQGLAQGDVANLPQGVDRFLVVENYQVQGQNQ